jgi:hypothetical protein
MTVKGQRLSFAALLLISTGCATSAPPVTTIAPVFHGTYRFAEIIPQSSAGLIVEGEFTLTSDSVRVTTPIGPCEPVTPSSVPNFRFRCRDLELTFDRRDPTHPRYRIPGHKLEKRSQCLERKANPDGQMVCSQYSDESVEVETFFEGRLRPLKRP